MEQSSILDMMHLNSASNVAGYTPVNLARITKNGALSGIGSIHRLTIDCVSGNTHRKG